jgi:hypothetical protein
VVQGKLDSIADWRDQMLRAAESGEALPEPDSCPSCLGVRRPRVWVCVLVWWLRLMRGRSSRRPAGIQRSHEAAPVSCVARHSRRRSGAKAGARTAGWGPMGSTRCTCCAATPSVRGASRPAGVCGSEWFGGKPPGLVGLAYVGVGLCRFMRIANSATQSRSPTLHEAPYVPSLPSFPSSLAPPFPAAAPSVSPYQSPPQAAQTIRLLKGSVSDGSPFTHHRPLLQPTARTYMQSGRPLTHVSHILSFSALSAL